MSAVSYRGPADVVLFQGETATELPGLAVLFENTGTYVRYLTFNPDRPERGTTTRVRVTLPDGKVSEGEVTYSKPFTLIFREPNPYYAEHGLEEPRFD